MSTFLALIMSAAVVRVPAAQGSCAFVDSTQRRTAEAEKAQTESQTKLSRGALSHRQQRVVPVLESFMVTSDRSLECCQRKVHACKGESLMYRA